MCTACSSVVSERRGGGGRGQVQRNTLCPVWDEAYVFDLRGCRATELSLELFDW